MEVRVENRGDIPFHIHSFEIQFGTTEKITLNTIKSMYQENISFIRRVEPGESTTYFYHVNSLVATKELFELFWVAISNKRKIKIVVRTDFEKEASTLIPEDIRQYIKENAKQYKES